MGVLGNLALYGAYMGGVDVNRYGVRTYVIGARPIDVTLLIPTTYNNSFYSEKILELLMIGVDFCR